jgi:hypothetical protein
MDGWNGDPSDATAMATWSRDATAMATWSRDATPQHASLEVSAGRHVSGGGDKSFGYSATLLVAGHSDPKLAGRYPQLCMGTVVHAPARKQSPDERGLERRQCPAADTNPRVSCPWAQERDTTAARNRRHQGRPQRPTQTSHTVDLDNPRARRAHPGARPTVGPPDRPAYRRPAICQQSTITVPTDIMSKLALVRWGRRPVRVRCLRDGAYRVALGLPEVPCTAARPQGRYWQTRRTLHSTLDASTAPPGASRSRIRTEPSLKTKKSRPAP